MAWKMVTITVYTMTGSVLLILLFAVAGLIGYDMDVIM